VNYYEKVEIIPGLSTACRINDRRYLDILKSTTFSSKKSARTLEFLKYKHGNIGVGENNDLAFEKS